MKKIFTICAGVLIALFVFVGLHLQSSAPATLGSIADGSAYSATTTDATWSAPGIKLIKTGYGLLGSVVVSVTGGNTLDIFDATTTDITKRTNGIATSSITVAHFSATPTVGTYTYDISFVNGLLIQVGGTVTNISTSTVTWR